MGTPFITHLEPTKLDAYNRRLPPSAQPSSIPKAFLDAMEVREAVFVKEQGVPLDNELDEDDSRSCHWIVYASVNEVVEPEVRDDVSGDVVRPRKSVTRSQPIGTLRLVPFPHPPHPKPGGVYIAVDGALVLTGAQGEDGVPKGEREIEAVGEAVAQSEERTYGEDRATTFHDGREPYMKLGRLAVVKEFRGHRIGRLLVNAALSWMREHPSYFNPSVANLGFEQLGIDKASDIPKFNGLVCAHAQEQVAGAWEKLGFQVDEKMGTWWEEGIPHVGMFQRLEIKPEQPQI